MPPCLVESIRDRAPSYLNSRFIVAEIYQCCVPFIPRPAGCFYERGL